MESAHTHWELVDSARAGDPAAREEFARCYEPVLRAYFAARWGRAALAAEIEDGVQEVFVDCLREGGALERADPTRPFRPFLAGVARTVAMRFEQRRARRPATALPEAEPPTDETRLSVVFDRAFAVQVMREARELQRERALRAGGNAPRRVELLQLRFEHGLTIAQIAQRWGEDAARVHHLYADAREDFRECLRAVVGRRNGFASAELERECEWMLEVLQRSGG